MGKKGKTKDSVVKIDSVLLESVNEFIQKDGTTSQTYDAGSWYRISGLDNASRHLSSSSFKLLKSAGTKSWIGFHASFIASALTFDKITFFCLAVKGCEISIIFNDGEFLKIEVK